MNPLTNRDTFLSIALHVTIKEIIVLSKSSKNLNDLAHSIWKDKKFETLDNQLYLSKIYSIRLINSHSLFKKFNEDSLFSWCKERLKCHMAEYNRDMEDPPSEDLIVILNALKEMAKTASGIAIEELTKDFPRSFTVLELQKILKISSGLPTEQEPNIDLKRLEECSLPKTADFVEQCINEFFTRELNQS